jgi:DMSO reductase anchor subunit
LGASVFHLGRPLGAWRAFLNFKRSWMSREIVMFGMFLPMLAAALALRFGALGSESTNLLKLLRAGLEIGAPIVGLLGVFCSMMIYHDTRRPLWNWQRGSALFFGTTIVLGAMGAAIVTGSAILFAAVIIAGAAKLLVEISALRHVTDRALTPLKKTALLITGKLQYAAFARLICVMVGGIGLPLWLALEGGSSRVLVAASAFALLLAGELIERFLFFTSVVAPKMPGGVAT